MGKLECVCGYQECHGCFCVTEKPNVISEIGFECANYRECDCPCHHKNGIDS